ncbi:GNAT family N-acetyltransferase [Zafaria sp. Z1313]|uniref:GNAT family N-acetyltransferase n=1 Tax=unclassified Zafaria TaxID=2828765 RepID=UPI002E7A199B|nr:GNAT family N-acetyltransferase [Zafaria sp. J156]MEE1621344.1 GNAT family N-acetyltransferase [Zafaria sp. J156]
MGSSASDELIGTWVTGWAGARGYESRHEGRVHAALRHDTTGDWEYIVFEPTSEELVAVAETLAKHPSRRLTAFANDSSALVDAAQAAGLDVVAAEEALMVAEMDGQDVEDPRAPEGFTIDAERDGKHAYVSIHDADDHDVVAASGHVSVVGDYAVFDRIITAPEFRRRGLGALVMRALVAIALEHAVDEGLLIASIEGQALYQYLGWTPLGTVVTLEARRA